jgi:hypothetical protein
MTRGLPSLFFQLLSTTLGIPAIDHSCEVSAGKIKIVNLEYPISSK